MNGKSSSNKVMTGIAVGAGAIIGGALIGAAGTFLYHSLNKIEEKKKKLDINRKSSPLSKRKQSISSSTMRSKRNSECSSRSEYETGSETNDEDEFFSCDSDFENTLVRKVDKNKSSEKEKKLFNEVDVLMKGDDEDRLKAFNLLKRNELEMSENPNFLWRYAKAHQIQATASKAEKDWEKTKEYVLEGLKYASKALELDERNADVHKWFAILTGMKSDFVPVMEKIQHGALFQKHIQIALDFKPDDYSLHHLLGRFKFEVANVSWFEKKIAASLFGDIPDVTYSDAISDLLVAEDLNPSSWKENRLLLAKCCIGDGNIVKAVHWLDLAKKITPVTKEDAACDQEIKTLLEKYKSYRK